MRRTVGDLGDRVLTDGVASDIASVRVTVTLRAGDPLARARIEVVAKHPDYGLTEVVFPDVAGIRPLIK